MKSFFLIFFILLSVVEASYIYVMQKGNATDATLQTILPAKKPLTAYTFENLRKTAFTASTITLGDEVSQTASSTARMFYFSTPVAPNSRESKKVSGLINIPKNPGIYPVIVMFRGFVPAEIFESGIGTQPSALMLAQNGFITLAPDFLGYGESDKPSVDSFEDRLETYTTALSLLSSLSTLNAALDVPLKGTITADTERVGIWGHSNGGHIALSVLAITGKPYPTVLWAPVSKSFPYTILYYADEYDDQGKATRKALSDFEKVYNTQGFSPPRFYRWIRAPIAIFQGALDQEVLPWWSKELSERLKEDYELDIEYTEYPNADHNLQPDGWNNAVLNSIAFYRNNLLP